VITPQDPVAGPDAAGAELEEPVELVGVLVGEDDDEHAARSAETVSAASTRPGRTVLWVMR
jgi:hypothetical protein